MKQPIRYFAIGLLTASLVLLIVVSFVDKPDTDITELSVEELSEALQEKGYHALPSDEYISLSMNKQPEEEEEQKDKDKDKDKDEKQDKEEEEKEAEDKEADKKDEEQSDVQKYTLNIEPNMLGPTISKLLKEHKIIDDEDAFNRYLETEGYAGYIQLGEHELSSDMSDFEIAEKIAKKR